MSTRTAVFLLVALGAAAPVAGAVTPAARCSAAKLKATAQGARMLARCLSGAAAQGVADTECRNTALNSLYGDFAAAEAVGGCATADDHVTIRTTVDLAMYYVGTLIRPSQQADPCASQKYRKVASKVFAILSAHAGEVRSGNAARLAAAIARAEARFTAGFDRIENNYACLDDGDADGVEAQLDGPIARIRGRLAPLCGDGFMAGPEACDGAEESACPGRCLADCTCRPIVCGDGLREGTEQCDGADATACPGACQSDCRCPTTCGNGVIDGSEQCDGADAAVCTASSFQCQAPGFSGECRCCSTGYCGFGFTDNCCGDARCVRNAQSPTGVCTPYTCTQASDCGVGHYECENGGCCAQPQRSCINIPCCAGSACTWATGTPLCCIPAGGACGAAQNGAYCCSGSCNATTLQCD